MSTNTSTPTNAPPSVDRLPHLGTCPECGTPLASLDVTLDHTEEQPALYTECQGCRETVNPV